VDFDFTDQQLDIKRAARDALAGRSGIEQVHAAANAGAYDPALLDLQIELGWPGLAISEEFGGLGLGIVDLVVLLEENGYALSGSPLLSTVNAALVIEAAGSDKQRRHWLPRLADGSAAAALGLRGHATDDLVADADDADVIVLVDSGVARLIPRELAEVTPVETIDLTRRYGRVDGDGEALPGDLTPGLDAAFVAVSAELVGVCQRALDLTGAYVKDREQFGRPIGSFQAVQHMLVEMFLHTELARSGAYWAAWLQDAEDPGAHEAALIAHSGAAAAGRAVTADAIQAHGGIGFTWEADVHWFFKRAQLDARLLGGAREVRREISKLVADRARTACHHAV
jgi:alkylation response protein AidB-like acyl-CoA dehydrogenase